MRWLNGMNVVPLTFVWHAISAAAMSKQASSTHGMSLQSKVACFCFHTLCVSVGANAGIVQPEAFYDSSLLPLQVHVLPNDAWEP